MKETLLVRARKLGEDVAELAAAAGVSTNKINTAAAAAVGAQENPTMEKSNNDARRKVKKLAKYLQKLRNELKQVSSLETEEANALLELQKALSDIESHLSAGNDVDNSLKNHVILAKEKLDKSQSAITKAIGLIKRWTNRETGIANKLESYKVGLESDLSNAVTSIVQALPQIIAWEQEFDKEEKTETKILRAVDKEIDDLLKDLQKIAGHQGSVSYAIKKANATLAEEKALLDEVKKSVVTIRNLYSAIDSLESLIETCLNKT